MKMTPDEFKKLAGTKADDVLRVLGVQAQYCENYRYWRRACESLLQIVAQSYVNRYPQDGIDALTDDLTFEAMDKAPLGLFATTFYTPYGHIRINVVPQPADDDESSEYWRDNISVGRPCRDGFAPMVYKTEVWAGVKGRDEDEDEYNLYELKYHFLSDRTVFEALQTISACLEEEAGWAYDWLKEHCTDYVLSMANQQTGELPQDLIDDLARDDAALAKSDDDDEVE